ncbi:OmpA family protein [Ravibacter arvi]|uniref:OmpA family protein n=1 Tax=Ravibacter arvi TaxID=2051041 RepID=A0ABP8M8Q1_9BACT
MKSIHIFAIAFTILAQLHVSAQSDLPGSKDHELLSRFQGSHIVGYSQKEFEAFTYPAAAGLVDYDKLKNPALAEGALTFIEYQAPAGVTATQVFRTYQTQLEKAGFRIIFSCRTSQCGSLPMHFVREYVKGSSSEIGNAMVGEAGSYLVASGQFQNNPYLVSLVVGDAGTENAARYAINFVRREKLDTDKVDVSAVTDRLQKEGRYAFYGIQFATASAVVKPESSDALKVIADYLKANPSVKALIVGHTDNTGDFAQNIALSEKRAQAVVAKLVNESGIKADRLTPVGVGMAAPLASNSSETGRAQNRRVELVIR